MHHPVQNIKNCCVPCMRGKCERMCPSHSVLCGRLDGAPLAPVLEAMYPGARVHHGFLQSFQAVTSAAGNASTDLKCASPPAALRALHLPSIW